MDNYDERCSRRLGAPILIHERSSWVLNLKGPHMGVYHYILHGLPGKKQL